ncbi:MAG TPA: YHS domain-containing protein, partial [Fimbriimonadaceae bacterium]|nr:YHS domain-containing protein [Fimbriimonadaceae bacterium]
MKNRILFTAAAAVAIVGIPLAIGCADKRVATGVAHEHEQGKLICPVMKTEIAGVAQAVGYSDYKGKRYYFCCDGCKPAFDKDPEEYLQASNESKTAPSEPQEIKPIKVGKYQIELWPPEDGVYAGEEIDIEFGVFDSTQEDKQLGGMKGVDFSAKGVVTMPSMPGMPDQKPHI